MACRDKKLNLKRINEQGSKCNYFVRKLSAEVENFKQQVKKLAKLRTLCNIIHENFWYRKRKDRLLNFCKPMAVTTIFCGIEAQPVGIIFRFV